MAFQVTSGHITEPHLAPPSMAAPVPAPITAHLASIVAFEQQIVQPPAAVPADLFSPSPILRPQGPVVTHQAGQNVAPQVQAARPPLPDGYYYNNLGQKKKKNPPREYVFILLLD